MGSVTLEFKALLVCFVSVQLRDVMSDGPVNLVEDKQVYT